MIDEAEKIMKRCQAGTRNYEEANNLHAACYAIIGKLLAQPEQEPAALVIDSVLVKSELPENYTGHLYTTPPQRKPLTHEQRFDLLTKFEPHKNKWEASAILIDMVEAAHGIKE